jgi:arylsulfatase A-like enzyme
MDRLFDESVRFENFYVSPSCSPTRASLLTGMHEFRNGVTHTIVPREHLNREATILPQLLKGAGYRTGFIGKWHLGSGEGYSPEYRGFDFCSTTKGGNRAEFDPVIIRNGLEFQREGFREDVYFDEAMTFMEESGDQPFFCYLATYSPHTPLVAPERNIEPYRDAVDEETAIYLGEVDNIDENLGRLLEFLREKNLEENTILIFMNDNGETEGLDLYNAGMRGCKCTIWHGGSRAMSFWRWPGHWKPHAHDHLTAHLDVLPTICELAGAEIPDSLRSGLDGFSLLPLLENEAPVAWHDDRLLFQHVARWPAGLAASHKHSMCGVRQGHYLLVRSEPCNDPLCREQLSQCTYLLTVMDGATKMTYTEENAPFHWGVTPPGQWALFDTKDDPACLKDLAAHHPDLVSTLSSAYDSWWDEVFPEMISHGGDQGRFRPIPDNWIR